MKQSMAGMAGLAGAARAAKLAGIAAAAALVVAAGTACAPLVIGAVAAGTAYVVTDRRTTGSQVDDQTIQLRLADELRAVFANQPVNINVNSFDRKVLLTGEVPDEAAKARAGSVATASQNVRAVVNELAVMPPTSTSERAADTALSAKVRAALINTREVEVNSIKFVTERGIVYLMGYVTDKEGQIAAIVASKVAGVKQVVKVFDVATQEEVNQRRLMAPK